MKKRIRFIYWAFLISIAAHFTLAPIVQRFKVVEASKEVVGQVILESPHPKPTPKPVITPTPRPIKPTKATKPKTSNAVFNHPHLPTRRGGQNEISTRGRKIATDGETPGPAQTTAPGNDIVATVAPTATPKPTCATPFADATTREKFVPETPELAREQGLSGVVHVLVDLSATGAVTSVKIADSAGSSLLDNAALDAARRTTYSPKTVDCEHVPGEYLFRVEFDSN